MLSVSKAGSRMKCAVKSHFGVLKRDFVDKILTDVKPKDLFDWIENPADGHKPLTTAVPIKLHSYKNKII